MAPGDVFVIETPGSGGTGTVSWDATACGRGEPAPGGARIVAWVAHAPSIEEGSDAAEAAARRRNERVVAARLGPDRFPPT